MFLDQGYEQTTIEAIAVSVGMTKRTIYALYDDKAALFKATVQHAIEQWAVPHAMLRSLETDDLEQTLKGVARMRIAQVMTPEGQKLQRIINTESYRFPSIFTAYYEQATRPVVDFLAALFVRHRASGKIRVAHPQMTANMFLSLVLGGPLRAMVSGYQPQAQQMEERIELCVHLFLNGIQTRK